MNSRSILALFVSLCIVVSAVAQTKPADDNDDVVKITTNLVQIDAVVTKNNKPVTNLTAEDFEIYEDGKRQTITSFAYVSTVPATLSSASEKVAPDKSAPDKTEPSPVVPAEPIKREAVRRTIAIVVDDLGMSAASMSVTRGQVRKLINERLSPDDLIAIIRTSGEIGALQQFTTNREILNRAVALLRWNVCSRTGISPLTAERMAARTGLPYSGNTQIREPYGSGCDPNSHANTRRAVNVVLDAMAKLPGRKSLILMSDDMPIGVSEGQFAGADYSSVGDNATNFSSALRKIAEKAIRASVVIYAVDTQGLQYTGLTAADEVFDSGRGTPVLVGVLKSRSRLLSRRSEGAELMARQTGGFQTRYANDYFDRILKDQTGYYLIGYRPTEETFNRKFHHITAKVKQSGLTVRTRAGFFGMTEEEAARVRPTVADQTNLALLSPFSAKDLELNLTSFFTHGKNEGGKNAGGKTEGSVVRSFIYLNAKNLSFTPVGDRYQTAIEIHGAVFGDNGALVEQVKLGAKLNLRQDEYEQALRDSLNLRLDLPVKRPGSYQVRVAVRDENSSKIGSAGELVTVPNLKNRRLAISGIVLRDRAETLTPTALMINPGMRRFAPNADLHFAFLLYNAFVNPATRSPNLVVQTRLFRDGEGVGTETEVPIVTQQTDLARLFATGVLKLDPNLEPGNYYLQVVITDKATREPPVMQWIDFEIVK